MYLSTKQHDQFRTLLMSFEIPFRRYVADVTLSSYATEQNFEIAMIAKSNSLQVSDPVFLRQLMPKECTPRKLNSLYSLFLSDLASNDIVPTDHDVPLVGAINLVTFSLTSQFQSLYNLFSGYNTFCCLAEIYRYSRNKLNHPGCRTLEDSHLVPVLTFVKDICLFLDEKYFIQKGRESILSEVAVLQLRKIPIPIPIHNLNETPYNDAIIVCRDDEIAYLKTFVYGTPSALRKRHSCCVYGYGGVGKTALVIEVVKEIVRDVIDNCTTNDYSPEYILFFSAKKRKLNIAQETGNIIEQGTLWHFETSSELIGLIQTALNLNTLRGYHKEGLIVVDNLETLSLEDRKEVKDFIETQTPVEMQFLITSRNSEEYESNYKLSGFVSESGIAFVQSYLEENSLDVQLNLTEINELLSLAKGNTLVLVLCLRRLSQSLFNAIGLNADFSRNRAWEDLKRNLGKLPPGAYEVISEFMFKDTFEQIENVFTADLSLFYSILRVFAVVQNNGIDLSTICLLTKYSYPRIETAVEVLCNCLIIEKKGTNYFINQFAEKYIVNRFIPDATAYQQLSQEIVQRRRYIREALENLQIDIDQRPDLAKIMQDWQITTDSDRISAAKMYHLYRQVKRQCDVSSKFKVEAALVDLVTESEEAEAVTAHPYIKYQKARILQMVDRSRVLEKRHVDEIVAAFRNAIYIIKTVEQYAPIQETKSYASLLWIFGQYLSDNANRQDAIRYLEESKDSFEHQGIHDQEYYQCITLLGCVYLEYYLEKRDERLIYLRRSKQLSQQLQKKRSVLGSAYKYANQLNENLKRYKD